MRRAIALWILLASLSASGLAQETHHVWDEQLARGVDALNEGRIQEAAVTCETILAEHPDAFYAYTIYWEALGRLKETDGVHAAVEAGLATLSRIPAEQRDEDYYSTVIRANDTLGRATEVERLTNEVVGRFPRGLFAQGRILNRARGESDPIKAVQIYDEYIKTFPENTSWVSSAAEQRFVVMLAVSIDTDKQAAVKAARDRGYKFRVLLTDGSVEDPYALESIPQLYVIDRQGNVRFHHDGYDDGSYLKKLAWMIDAIR